MSGPKPRSTDCSAPTPPCSSEFYDVRPGGNWEGHTILNRSHHPQPLSAAEEATLARCRELLRRAREPRVRPGWDDKVLADWNGMMIAALARAGVTFSEAAWIDAARSAFEFVRTRMTRDGRLHHTWRHGVLKHPASVDDYANMAAAALALERATGSPDYRDQAVAWIDVLDRHYWDPEAGGYHFAASDTPALIVRTKAIHDNAVPAGNGTLVDVLARLYLLTGKPGSATAPTLW